MAELKTPLSNLQIELLQLYNQNVSEDDLIAIKRILAQYFAERAADAMDVLWDENGWSNETMDSWLKGEGKSPKQPG
jgi:hypothetical protein